jgi:manganese/zinc/iron transport system permease protein
MATMTGAAFLAALLFAPQRGLVRKWTRARSQRRQFAGEMLLVHLSQHEGDPALANEATLQHMAEHMRWPEGFGEMVAGHLVREGFVSRINGSLALTPLGREVAQRVMLR